MYATFASVYDRLMQDIPYEGWVQYLRRLFEIHDIQPRDILDLGCGTGNVTIPLAEMGFQLTGLDMSPEMLSVAEEKARSKDLRINWVQQDMREMDLGRQKFDLIISMTDSLNYLENPGDLENVFRKAYSVLKMGGWMIFDLNSFFKIREVFGNNVFTSLDEDIAYIWENEYNSDNRTCYMSLTFFVQDNDGRYRRFTENHHETGYPAEEVEYLLNRAGFVQAAVYGEDTYEKPLQSAERIYFVAQKTEPENNAGR